MISKRVRRASRPQETLSQFALNTSKGIDMSKAITDSDTVLDSVNLTVNDDGSLSLRSPIVAEKFLRSFTGSGIFQNCAPLWDSRYVLRYGASGWYFKPGEYLHHGFGIFDLEDSGWNGNPDDMVEDATVFAKECDVVCTDVYSGVEYVLGKYVPNDLSNKGAFWNDNLAKRRYFGTYHLINGFNFENCHTVQLGNSTLVTNVLIDRFILTTGVYPKSPESVPMSAMDATLYKDVSTEVPRSVVISKNDSGRLILKIIIPEPIVYGSDTFKLDANIAADNPYALRDRYGFAVPIVKGIVVYYADPTSPPVTVAQLTENVSARDISLMSQLSPSHWDNTEGVYLKAVCNLSNSDRYFAQWSFSLDGVVWHSLTMLDATVYTFKTPKAWYDTSVDDTAESTENTSWFRMISKNDLQLSPTNELTERTDVLGLGMVKAAVQGELSATKHVTVRYTVITYLGDSLVKDESTKTYTNDVAIVSQQQMSLQWGNDEKIVTGLPNANLGEKLYYNGSTYTFGIPGQDNIVYVSEPNSHIVPMSNVLDLGMYANDAVVAILPWRDYLMSFTERAIYLSQRSENGFLTKSVSSATGVPRADSKCVKASLNGIIMKVHGTVYYAYPNLYASSDTVLQLTDISRPVHHLLSEYFLNDFCFAEIIEDKYVLMSYRLAADETPPYTYCLIYDLAKRTWEHFEYPCAIVSLHHVGSEWRATVHDTEHKDAMLCSIFEDAQTSAVYDTLFERVDNLSYVKPQLPIKFALDTGQKTNNISETRQFVESKLMFATLDEKDSFPFKLQIAIDGDPHIVTKDVATDAPFWKPLDTTSEGSIGVLNSNFVLSSNPDSKIASIFNTLRQLVVRYSGKGKSIRHLIEGESQCNFKLYETYVRYKPISKK